MEPGWQVPKFTAAELRPKAHDYCVCVFVMNENGRVRSQLEKMKPLAEQADIIIGDGGSTDGSLDEGFLRSCGVSVLLTKTGPGRLSAQMRMALAYALDRGYAGTVVVDGNDKDDVVAGLPLFLEKLRQGYDHVQGSRYIPGGQSVNTPASRHWGVKLLHAPLLSLASGRRHTDSTNGFRAYSRRLLLDPRVQPFRDVFLAYELHYYLAIRASRLGFRMAEVPVTRRYPAVGPTPSKIKGWRGNWKILKTLLAACAGRFNP